MARITIDNTNEKFGSKISIADLAQFTEFAPGKTIVTMDSDSMDIYRLEAAMTKEWKNEIESFEYEFMTGYSATFKDGSKIHIGAWLDRDEDGQCTANNYGKGW